MELCQLDNGSRCAQSRTKAQAKLADVRTRLEDLRRMEGALEGLIRLCGASRGKVQCPLIAVLMDDAVAEGLLQVHHHERRFVDVPSAARRGLRISR